MNSKIIPGGFFANLVVVLYLGMLPPQPTTALLDLISLDRSSITTVGKESTLIELKILFPTKCGK